VAGNAFGQPAYAFSQDRVPRMFHFSRKIR
jgi:hypothetical protein